jgi:hypothetical protein
MMEAASGYQQVQALAVEVNTSKVALSSYFE